VVRNDDEEEPLRDIEILSTGAFRDGAGVGSLSETLFYVNRNAAMHYSLYARAGVPNLSLTMHPFSISTDEYVPQKNFMTKYFIMIIHRYM